MNKNNIDSSSLVMRINKLIPPSRLNMYNKKDLLANAQELFNKVKPLFKQSLELKDEEIFSSVDVYKAMDEESTFLTTYTEVIYLTEINGGCSLKIKRVHCENAQYPENSGLDDTLTIELCWDNDHEKLVYENTMEPDFSDELVIKKLQELFKTSDKLIELWNENNY